MYAKHSEWNTFGWFAENKFAKISFVWVGKQIDIQSSCWKTFEIERFLKLEEIGRNWKTVGIDNCQFKANWIVVHPMVFQLGDVTQSEFIKI